MQTELKSLCVNKVWDLVLHQKIARSSTTNGFLSASWEKPDWLSITKQDWSHKDTRKGQGLISPVVRFVIALAVHGNLKLDQMDVKTAFLNGELTEELFMKQQEGFVDKGKDNLVCRLKQSIYGLKQSPRCWNAALDDYLKKMNSFRQNEIPVSMCPPMENLSVYVDDILIAGRTDERIVLTLMTWEIYTTS